MTRFQGRLSFREWPLTVKVMAALAVALLFPGIVAVLAAVRSYRAALADLPPGTSHAVTLAQALSIALPILMWLVALGIGWLVANRLIVVPLLRMRAGVESYAAGDRNVRLGRQRFFSREVTALAAAFDTLADDIDSHDREIEAALQEQRRLTREVHHRVKNNLQIVSSLLSIQAREASSAEVSHAYALVQARVAALAIVHRWMYESDAPGGGNGVDLKALTTDLAAGLEQNLASSEQVAVSIVAHVERLYVGQDTAVPLAFLITELISCAARDSAPEPLDATVTARADGAQAVLTIAAPVFIGANRLTSDSRNPSSRIVLGMARQLRAPLIHNDAAGSYCIAFQLPTATS